MNEPVESKPAELSQEEAKEVVGGATSIEFTLGATSVVNKIIAAVQALGASSATKPK